MKFLVMFFLYASLTKDMTDKKRSRDGLYDLRNMVSMIPWGVCDVY